MRAEERASAKTQSERRSLRPNRHLRLHAPGLDEAIEREQLAPINDQM
jgi:hypothetical protein